MKNKEEGSAGSGRPGNGAGAGRPRQPCLLAAFPFGFGPTPSAGLYVGTVVEDGWMDEKRRQHRKRAEIFLDYPLGKSSCFATGRSARDLRIRAVDAGLTTAWRRLVPRLADGRGQRRPGLVAWGLQFDPSVVDRAEQVLQDMFLLRYGKMPFRDKVVGKTPANRPHRRVINFSGVNMAEIVGLLAPHDRDPDDFRDWARRLIANPPAAILIDVDRQTVIHVIS